ncbi:hypothetical protein E2C00_25835 [Streptomyces sp. WAC05374]|uniref:hypothetical protein n=1 Tax=Streptomyces sp. WAC05374 TaxID=2487420 RepID=UPI000F873297|nr:hypothetical protein [Streptomyces sp. WAC05374]RST16428.1 hypothetical protein EF905_12315 [Streptomyces sp. WAC05374]TDF43571.1 hypothetical protein E2B92_19505 [Streptomyces sp. WAC05374]TDF51527.1 hypothetical protein E2C00_25835 [Streptomyces sp. WAC05374]TDF53318.1 hypothetical protein E2C02_20140 [Streptomyces sp. WAC05374]
MMYLLAHEELQEAATRFLGDARLSAHRDRIHAWADGWRRAAWPAGTPEYLLVGYFRVLHAHGESARMVACALDADRHRALLDVTGGDAAALAEIGAAQDALLGREPPDLRTMTLLAVRRDALTDRNRGIPTRLPAVWARLGHPVRAEALARSLPDPSRRARALATLSEALAEARAGAGPDAPGAEEVADEAEAAARSVTGPEARAEALARVSEAWAEAGHVRRARELAREAECAARAGFGTAYELMLSVRAVARAWARLGDVERVESLARELETRAKERRQKTTGDELPHWAATTARALAWAGDIDGAETAALTITRVGAMVRARVAAELERHGYDELGADLAREADEQARTVGEAELRSLALAEVAAAAARAGDAGRAERLLREADALTRAGTGDTHRARAQARSLVAVVAGWVRLGRMERAEDLALRSGALIRSGMRLRPVSALVWEADVWARLGRGDRARSSVREAETVARAAGRSGLPRRKLAEVAVTLAWTGESDRAEALARTITDPDVRAHALAEVTTGIAARGHTGRAHAVAAGITSPAPRARALAAVVEGMARAGATPGARPVLDEAEAAARATPTVGPRAQALAEVAAARMAVGQTGHARSALGEAVALAEWVAGRDSDAGAHVRAVAALVARLGDPDRAARLARGVMDLGLRTDALLELATGRALAGESEQARLLVQEAEDVIGTHTDYGRWKPVTTGLAEVAETWARCGRSDRAAELAGRAAELARAEGGPDSHHCLARTDAALALARQGDVEGVEAVAGTIAAPWCRDRALAQAVEGLARSGRADRAEALARAITLPRWQAVALVGVARRSDTPRAHRLLVRALRLDAWWTAADLLAAEIPDLMVGVLDELLVFRPDSGASDGEHDEPTWLPRAPRQWTLMRHLDQREPEPLQVHASRREASGTMPAGG